MSDLLKFLYDAHKLEDPDSLIQSLMRFLASYGLDRYNICEVSRGGKKDKERKFGTLTNYPREWIDHYLANNYITPDPIYRGAFIFNQPFTWDEALKRNPSRLAYRLMKEAEEFSLRDGMACKIHSLHGKTIGFAFSTSENKLYMNTLAMRIIHTASFHFYTVYSDLLGEKMVPLGDGAITDREREVLLWISQGLSKGGVADKLMISESCVKRHCESIFAKLNTNSIAHSVAKALRLGLIDPF